ncbi:Cell division topological specificity factor protein [gamma proteobacterium HdN1]|nr:Cell division topological specificity factor protein [gamma proteobacterium HdN1]
MSFLDYFRTKRPTSAAVAKDRLQIIVAHERSHKGQPDYLPALQRDLLAVIRKYVPIDEDQISVSLDKAENCEVLELNVTLTSDSPAAAAMS